MAGLGFISFQGYFVPLVLHEPRFVGVIVAIPDRLTCWNSYLGLFQIISSTGIPLFAGPCFIVPRSPIGRVMSSKFPSFFIAAYGGGD